jgi:putative transposase
MGYGVNNSVPLTLEAAKASHPERWNGRKTRDWSLPETVYLNPEKEMEKNTSEDANQKAVS